MNSSEVSQNICSNTSNVIYSDQYPTTSMNRKRNKDNPIGEKQGGRKRAALKRHKLIERNRRMVWSKHMKELSALIKQQYITKSSKISQVNLLKIAGDLLNNINLRYENESVLPSYLTKDENHFLNVEVSNSFLFMTTMESSLYRIIHVTDSIDRVLHITSEKWLDHDLLSFIHSDDLSQVQNQLISLTNDTTRKFSVKCRIKQGNDSYSSVIINGMIKQVDQFLKPVSKNEQGYSVFIGICYLPLINEYSEKNMCLYKNPQSSIFSCRCSPNDWKIFLIDHSRTTFPLTSMDIFYNKSILDFIYIDDQLYFYQTLLKVISASTHDLIPCRFLHAPMLVEIKSFINPSNQQIDFIELIFESINSLNKIRF
ncbi:unnamed protein product [Adineta steineri]|uniref:BHLH domain-containing protein n=1 Tax=Adineta steineri TaxID=433720 RepID=A0A815DNZ5_9BILA|nr:unnamed protein product [Adineta steineri]CAF1303638.1 unnamed protein product [Adineta steineri]